MLYLGKRRNLCKWYSEELKQERKKMICRKIFHLVFSLDGKSHIDGGIASLSTPHVSAGCVGQGEVRGADWNINIRRISFIFWTNHRVTIGVFLLADCGPAPLAGNKSINPGAEPHLAPAQVKVPGAHTAAPPLRSWDHHLQPPLSCTSFTGNIGRGRGGSA